ncbi:Glutaredoxin-like domain [Ectothiorhodospira magna]|uniref:Glutaredoxin-like domain n=1 Tax=Ectothiorhodospira magna TaxID=867345 RepID=A0A1H9CGH5_9GAMM|nr:glutaredoxin family protein [Ectothiorhodospira magna]SEP99718.1 Glutaredoxin-like domain [Ectothiorhodospira magna]
MRPVVTLYHRQGCHLCERMAQALRPLQEELAFDIQEKDIDEDPVLCQRFRTKIPVLAVDGDILCCHVLDERGLRAALAED